MAPVKKHGAEQELSPKERILAAGKRLFAVLGYENTTLEAICRESNTSEAQLFKHFGSKEGLLEAIFEDGWGKLRMRLAALQTLSSPRQKLKKLGMLMIQLFGDDPQLRDLMLLEGRRVRGERKMIMLTASYRDFVALIDSLIAGARPQGMRYPPALIRAALNGAFEGMLRELVVQERWRHPAGFTSAEAEKFVTELIDRLLGPD